MSDDARTIAGPPRRPNSGGGAASLLRVNRAAQQEQQATQEPTRIVGPPPPAPRRTVQQTIASSPEATDTFDSEAVIVGEPSPFSLVEQVPRPSNVPEQPVAPQPTEQTVASPPVQTAPVTATQAAPVPSTPYTRRRDGDAGTEHPDDIVKVTFEVRRGDRDKFNNAFAAAMLNEGYITPKDILVRIYTDETKRLEDTYNHGQPFPQRQKQAPRGRPIRRAE